jgi:hypothetical protein
MMKQIIILIFALLATNGVAQIELRHGLLTGGGKGTFTGAEYRVDDWEGITKIVSAESRYKYSALLGYKFRISPVNGKSFFDADLTFGEKKIRYLIMPDWESWESGDFSVYGENRSYSISLALSYGYRLHKGLYIGAGVEPAYRYRTEGTYPLYKNRFDAPLFAKLGYDFGFIDLSFSYKMGMTKMHENDYMKGGKINDWQLQLFIPF